jgi:hypothetical protein
MAPNIINKRIRDAHPFIDDIRRRAKQSLESCINDYYIIRLHMNHEAGAQNRQFFTLAFFQASEKMRGEGRLTRPIQPPCKYISGAEKGGLAGVGVGEGWSGLGRDLVWLRD